MSRRLHSIGRREAQRSAPAKKRICLAGLLLILMLTSIPPSNALTEEEIRTDLAEAYEATAKAEASGADVKNLIQDLNEAATILSSAQQTQYEQAKKIIDNVKAEAPNTQTQGEQRLTNRLYLTALALIIITALTILIWTRGSRWIWGTWLKAHKGWRVEQT